MTVSLANEHRDQVEEASRVDGLLDLGRAIERIFEVRLRKSELSTAQLRILEIARRRGPEESNPGLLATELIQQNHSVSGLLNRLEDRGLVRREHDRKDKRMIHVWVTSTGNQLLKQTDVIRARLEAEVRKIQEDHYLEDWATAILALEDWRTQRA